MTTRDILIRLPPERLSTAFDPDREQVALAQTAGDAIVLRRVPIGGGPGDHLRLVGTTSAMTTTDLFHVLNLNHATGTVIFEDGPVRKQVFLRNGEIIFAQSSLDQDRLGESLIRAGLLTQAQLDEAAQQIRAGRKLGQILVEQGWITPEQLFQGVKRQVAEIVWSLIDWNAAFAFYEGFQDPGAVLALNLPTWRLLAEGIRRSAAWSHVPPDVPDSEIMVQMTEASEQLVLTVEERRVLSLVAGGMTLGDLIAQGGLGRLETLKVVHNLLRRGIVLVGARTPRPQGGAPGCDLAAAVQSFTEVFCLVRKLVQRDHPELDIFARINTFVDSMPEDMRAVFGSSRFDSEGRIDVGDLTDRLAGVENPRARLIAAFNEVLYFILFEIKHLLSEADTDKVLSAVDRMKLF